MLSAYSTIFQLGHKALQELLNYEVNIEEKVDGSQISWSIDKDSHLFEVRSKNCEVHLDSPGMFTHAAEDLRLNQSLFTPGWIYRGEYLSKPKHNALKYDRIPVHHVIIYDIEIGPGDYLNYEDKLAHCKKIGFECVPLLFSGMAQSSVDMLSLLQTQSCLGNVCIEGFVVKPKAYNLFGLDKKLLIGKVVSDAFKELHRESWGNANPGHKDILELIGNGLRTEARWNKGIQHLRDRGVDVTTPKCIGQLIIEIQKDIVSECRDEIEHALYRWAIKDLLRKATSGVAEFFKQQLLESALKEAHSESSSV